jgi:cytochrome b6-f complex iron-sulfur subunit
VNRKAFLRDSAYVCLGMTGLSMLSFACAPAKYIEGIPGQNKLAFSRNEFIRKGKNRSREHSYVIVKHDSIQFPIVVYREKEGYKALLLRCTHQGSELNVHGDLITCPAHGSEFGRQGEVVQGPAEYALTSFPVSSDQQNIYIHLS